MDKSKRLWGSSSRRCITAEKDLAGRIVDNEKSVKIVKNLMTIE